MSRGIQRRNMDLRRLAARRTVTGRIAAVPPANRAVLRPGSRPARLRCRTRPAASSRCRGRCRAAARRRAGRRRAAARTSRVDEPLAGVQLHLLASALRVVPVRGLALGAVEGQRDVRVADEVDPEVGSRRGTARRRGRRARTPRSGRAGRRGRARGAVDRAPAACSESRNSRVSSADHLARPRAPRARRRARTRPARAPRRRRGRGCRPGRSRSGARRARRRRPARRRSPRGRRGTTARRRRRPRRRRSRPRSRGDCRGCRSRWRRACGRIVYSVPSRLRLPFVILGLIGVSEAAVLRLRPRERPEAVDVAERAYFSDAELERARRFRTGQRRLGWVRGAIQLAALGSLARRPPERLLAKRAGVGTGAAAAVGLAAGLSVVDLPFRAVGRERARARRADHPGLGRLGGRRRQGPGDRVDPVRGRPGRCCVAGLRRFGRGWWLPGAGAAVAFGALDDDARPARARPDLQPLRAAARGSGPRATCSRWPSAPACAWGRSTRSTRRAARPRSTPTSPGSGRPSGSCSSTRCCATSRPGRSTSSSPTSSATCASATSPRGMGLLAVVAPSALLAIARLAERIAPAGRRARAGRAARPRAGGRAARARRLGDRLPALARDRGARGRLRPGADRRPGDADRLRAPDRRSRT